MNTAQYVTELAYLKRKGLKESIAPRGDVMSVTPPGAPTHDEEQRKLDAQNGVGIPQVNTPEPAATAPEAPKDNGTPAPTTNNKVPEKKDPGKQAFAGGILSDIGSSMLHSVYKYVSGDIYHDTAGRIGNNPAYTGNRR